jgi:hypothetical protein
MRLLDEVSQRRPSDAQMLERGSARASSKLRRPRLDPKKATVERSMMQRAENDAVSLVVASTITVAPNMSRI